jgi:hypothetical protein
MELGWFVCMRDGCSCDWGFVCLGHIFETVLSEVREGIGWVLGCYLLRFIFSGTDATASSEKDSSLCLCFWLVLVHPIVILATQAYKLMFNKYFLPLYVDISGMNPPTTIATWTKYFILLNHANWSKMLSKMRIFFKQICLWVCDLSHSWATPTWVGQRSKICPMKIVEKIACWDIHVDSYWWQLWLC